MRGAYIVTSLLVSTGALMGCASNGQENAQPARSVTQHAGLVQDSVAPYRWVVCGDAPACRPRTPKTIVTVTHAPTIKSQSIKSPAAAVSQEAAMSLTTPHPFTQPPAPTRVVVQFSHNSSYLDGVAQRALNDLPYAGVFNVRAYTDSTGSDRYNAWLSARRAERVKEYVIRKGIEPQRVRIEALGECCFIASNESPEGRAANRRVEIVISKQT